MWDLEDGLDFSETSLITEGRSHGGSNIITL